MYMVRYGYFFLLSTIYLIKTKLCRIFQFHKSKQHYSDTVPVSYVCSALSVILLTWEKLQGMYKAKNNTLSLHVLYLLY